MRRILATATTLVVALSISQAYGQYHQGPRGGCYTITKSGGKRYVDRSLCGGNSSNTGAFERASSTSKKGEATSPAEEAPSSTVESVARASDSNHHLGPHGDVGAVQHGRSDSQATAMELPKEKAKAKIESGSPTSDGKYHLGPRGGCYTISASGSKRYVDRSLCQ